MKSEKPFSIRLMACDWGASVWLIELAGRTLLFDAWLDDPYFSGPAGFFSAHRSEPALFSANSLPPVDALVLSSAEQDHAHPCTLAKLDRGIPVYARPEAARLAARLGFAQITALAPGQRAQLWNGDASLLALEGYGRNTPFVMREQATGERVCIAQHGVNARWLTKHSRSAFSGEFAPDAAGRLTDTLCIGVHTTLLRPLGLPRWVLGDAGTILPDPLESAAIVARFSPRRVLFSHATREVEQGFAVRHLLRYPSAHDDLGHAQRAFRENAPGPRIAGLPAPAAWL